MNVEPEKELRQSSFLYFLQSNFKLKSGGISVGDKPALVEVQSDAQPNVADNHERASIENSSFSGRTSQWPNFHESQTSYDGFLQAIPLWLHDNNDRHLLSQ